MKKLMLFLLLLFSINVTAQNVVDSVSVAETNDGKQLWGKTLELNKNIHLWQLTIALSWCLHVIQPRKVSQ